MFCVHCGAEGAATFCPLCGLHQQATDRSMPPQLESGYGDEEIVEALVAWPESIQYETLLGDSEVRERIAAAARHATAGVTGEDLLAVFDAVSPIGFSLGKLTTAILPIYDKLGIKTQRQSQGIFDAAPGRVMLAVLCTLAAKSLVIAEVHQDADRCSLIADIPSGLITNRGQLAILIEMNQKYVQLSLATTISGQWYDWGKSQRMMDELFSAVHADLTEQQRGQAPRYRRVA